jgi:hypothetical protein
MAAVPNNSSVPGRVCSGDYVVSADELPIGRVESVLGASSGDRLLIVRAYLPRSYAFAPTTDVCGFETDPGTHLRWHWLAVTAQGLVARGIFRRDLGRLVRDPFPVPTLPAPDDRSSAAVLRQILEEDPLTAGGDFQVAVQRGVAVLGGWLGTVAGKVAAERLARTTPGIWDAVNRLHSDEETNAALRARLRERLDIAPAVRDVRVSLGRAVVILVPGRPLQQEALLEVSREVPGIREFVLDPDG